MSALLENIGLIILQILAWIGELSNALIQNPIFIILMAVIILKLLYKLILHIISKREIEKMPYYSLDEPGSITFDKSGNGGGDNRYDDLTEEEFMHEYTGL